jgi:hypothetical protein
VFVDCATICTAFLTMLAAGCTVSASLRGASAAVKSDEEEGEEEAD